MITKNMEDKTEELKNYFDKKIVAPRNILDLYILF